MLIPTAKKETRFQLPVLIKTKNGNLKRYRYYECEADLYKAYRQLKAMKNSIIIPFQPVIY